MSTRAVVLFLQGGAIRFENIGAFRRGEVAAACRVEIGSGHGGISRGAFDKDRASACRQCCHTGCAGAGERIKHEAPRWGECSNELGEKKNRLGARVLLGAAPFRDQEELVDRRVDRLRQHQVGRVPAADLGVERSALQGVWVDRRIEDSFSATTMGAERIDPSGLLAVALVQKGQADFVDVDAPVGTRCARSGWARGTV